MQLLGSHSAIFHVHGRPIYGILVRETATYGTLLRADVETCIRAFFDPHFSRNLSDLKWPVDALVDD